MKKMEQAMKSAVEMYFNKKYNIDSGYLERLATNFGAVNVVDTLIECENIKNQWGFIENTKIQLF